MWRIGTTDDRALAVSLCGVWLDELARQRRHAVLPRL
jgi:hypothetical protein